MQVATLIDRETVQEMVKQGAQLVEVLPAKEYAEDHLPGAVSHPLKQLEGREAAGWDQTATGRSSCTAGMPLETWLPGPRRGSRASVSTRSMSTRRASSTGWPPGCRPRARTTHCPRAGDALAKGLDRLQVEGIRVGDVRDRARAAGWDLAVVVDEERVVLGMLWSKQLEMDPNLAVEKVMRTGPSTFRPYVPIKEMADYLVEHDHDSVPITTSDGKLVGVLYKSEAVRLAVSASACVRKMIT